MKYINKRRYSINEIILVVISIIGILITLCILYSMPSAFLKEFEKSYHEVVKKRDKELEEKGELNKEFRKWLLK